MKQLFAALLLIAHTAFADDVVKLSGKIQNPLSDSITITYNDNWLAYYPKEYNAVLDKNGHFSLTIPVPSSIYVQAEIKHGNKVADVIVKAGADLVMTVNAAHFDSTIHYTGKGSEIANFIALHTIEKGRMNQYTIKVKGEIIKDPTAFIPAIEKDKKAELDFLEKHKAGLPTSFIQYYTGFYQYYNYFFMQQYPQMHEIVKLQRYTDTVPAANYSVIKQMPTAFEDSLLSLPPYLLYLTGIFDMKLKAEGMGYLGKDTLKQQRLQDSIYALAYTTMPDKSGEYFVAQALYGSIKYQPIEKTHGQFDRFKNKWPASSYMPLLEKQVAIAERMAPGQPAPDIDIITQDGKKMKLSDLKGKVVYLGFWASWCRQCVGEMIGERKIKDLIKNKPLEFVYVSIDDDTTTDNMLIKKYKMEGTFTHPGGGWNAKEISMYGIQGLPAYFLIDEDGKIALQNTPSPPQSTELILAIERLFK